MKTALITGITGQDGTYLAEHLINLGYDVFGMIRGQNNPKRVIVENLIPQLHIVEGDLLDQGSLITAIEASQPDEVYNLGAISFVPLSFTQPVNVAEITGFGVMRMLEAIRIVNPKIRFYQASSSEMFGSTVDNAAQNEKTLFHPRSPYGVAKVYGYHTVVNYREAYGIFACNGILFNHESPRRGLEFVTRKITNAAVRIKLGLDKVVKLGNLDSERDWGFAGDYVRAMSLMLRHSKPDDYVIGTGISHSIKDVCIIAFGCLGLNYLDHVVVDKEFARPAELWSLRADPAKAARELGWTPNVHFPALIRMMVESDMKRLGSG